MFRGFPGGHQEPGEDDIATAIREVDEETGIKVTDHFQLLGSINDRVVLQRSYRLLIRCFVFAENPNVDRKLYDNIDLMTLDPNEVRACGWCKIPHLISLKNQLVIEKDVSSFFSKNLSNSFMFKFREKATNLFGLQKVCFTAISLEIDPMYISNESQFADHVPVFTLWGLTLGLVNDFLYNLTKFLDTDLYAKEKFLFERIYVEKHFKDAKIHNLLIHVFRKSAKTLLGRKITWGEMMMFYPSFYSALITISAVSSYPVLRKTSRKLLKLRSKL